MTQFSRVNWSDALPRKHFIDLCLYEANSGFRSGATLKPSAWTRIAEGFEKTIGKRLNQKQLKNGWDYMKRQYQTWTKLTNTTGHGYNLNHPDAKQFRYKPLPHCEELEQLFDGVLATGIENLSSGMEEIPEIGSTSSTDSISTHSTSFVRQMEENEETNLNKSNECEDHPKGKKQKRRKFDQTHEEVCKIIEVLEKDRGPSVDDCMKILRRLLTYEDPQYFVATNALCKRKEYQVLWMGMPSDGERIAWIRSLTKKP
ncbi:hypothetical protein Dsin_019373 [Dipteronia sinensis]|uniref:Myb/SANT-like domain-containing protein n=1 Tax=Dipteronia sinensis TaxID=43782 RepID=A0AAE0A7L9_9ROSI|nr:hypothetical protein Dsin_019373 [Dipteronia sinensis]